MSIGQKMGGNSPPIPRHRIAFASSDAKTFNVMRDKWREGAHGMNPPKSALALISLLPGYINREYGYAFPTNKQLAETTGKSIKTIDRGLEWLEKVGLIDRVTRYKKDDKREAAGRERRIFLTIPAEVNGQVAESEWSKVSEVNGQFVETPETPALSESPDTALHAPGSEWTKGRSEWTDGVSISLTLSTYSKKKLGRGTTREAIPRPFTNDIAFVDAFDREVVKRASKAVDGAAVEDVIRDAFDAATDSDREQFMPFYWESVCRLDDEGAARDWFLNRASRAVGLASTKGAA